MPKEKKTQEVQPLGDKSFKVEQTTVVDDGLHNGEIIRVDERLEPYHYLDVIVSCDDIKKEDGTPLELKYGFPARLTKNTNMGKTLTRFGANLDSNEQIKVSDFLKEKTPVTYQTLKNDDGFSDIVEGSLKPK